MKKFLKVMSLICVLGLATEGVSQGPRENLEKMRMSAFESCSLTEVQKLVTSGYKVQPYDLSYFLNYAQGIINSSEYSRYQAGLIAQFLIDHGADVNYTYYQNTSLMQAALFGLDNVVEILLKKGATVNQKYDAVKAKNLNSPQNGWTALEYACEGFSTGQFILERIRTIKLLLVHGAIASPQDIKDIQQAQQRAKDLVQEITDLLMYDVVGRPMMREEIVRFEKQPVVEERVVEKLIREPMVQKQSKVIMGARFRE